MTPPLPLPVPAKPPKVCSECGRRSDAMCPECREAVCIRQGCTETHEKKKHPRIQR